MHTTCCCHQGEGVLGCHRLLRTSALFVIYNHPPMQHFEKYRLENERSFQHHCRGGLHIRHAPVGGLRVCTIRRSQDHHTHQLTTPFEVCRRPNPSLATKRAFVSFIRAEGQTLMASCSLIVFPFCCSTRQFPASLPLLPVPFSHTLGLISAPKLISTSSTSAISLNQGSETRW